MAPFFPITICRSDGLLQVTTRGGLMEPNQPTAAQMSNQPDANGTVAYYKQLPADHSKVVDWNRKIGGMLMETLGKEGKAGKAFILESLPTNYILYEYVKYTPSSNSEDKKSDKGRHAAGNFERQDAYLYGHPQGRRKRYRSPADFFPHVLWLATDPEGDSRNCSCKICSPDGEDEVKDVKESKDVKEPNDVKDLKEKTPVSGKKTIAKPPSAVRSLEQKADSEPNGSFMYRPGELVWFDNGANWRLGVVSKRQVYNNRPRYLLQPLSNPLQHQAPLIKEQEGSLRPWLAWSVPTTTIEGINNSLYEHVPWERVVRGDFNGGRHRDYVVDGSILAAKQIDSSYSLFDRIDTALAGPGEIHYNGMFLGAEKIWVGEPVRIRIPGNDVVVMIISKLIERTAPPSTSIVTFVGDVYKLVEMPMPYGNRSEWPTPDLPPRMINDLRFRNEIADLAKKMVWYEWRLLDPGAKKGLADIKGRWYETRTLLPILRGGEKFQQDLAKGTTSDAGEWMNGRLDKNGNPETRRKNRRDTLGRAVPPEFKVSRGLDGLPADDAFPDAQVGGASSSFVEGDINEFTNF